MMCACVWFVRQWSVHTKRYHISTAFPYKDCIFVYVVGCWYSHQNQFAHTQNIYSDTIAISIDCRSKASEIQRISLFLSLLAIFFLSIPWRLQIMDYRIKRIQWTYIDICKSMNINTCIYTFLLAWMGNIEFKSNQKCQLALSK